MSDHQQFQCDVCGRFVSLRDIESGKGIHRMITEDTHFSAEDYETLCPAHKEEGIEMSNKTETPLTDAMWLTEVECVFAWNECKDPNNPNGFHEELNATLTAKFGNPDDLVSKRAVANEEDERC